MPLSDRPVRRTGTEASIIYLTIVARSGPEFHFENPSVINSITIIYEAGRLVCDCEQVYLIYTNYKIQTIVR